MRWLAPIALALGLSAFSCSGGSGPELVPGSAWDAQELQALRRWCQSDVLKPVEYRGLCRWAVGAGEGSVALPRDQG